MMWLARYLHRSAADPDDRTLDRTAPGPELSQEHPQLAARLTVNISSLTEAALVGMCDREGVSMTEATRRLVGYGQVVYEAACQGRSVVSRGAGTPDEELLLAEPPREGGTR